MVAHERSLRCGRQYEVRCIRRRRSASRSGWSRRSQRGIPHKLGDGVAADRRRGRCRARLSDRPGQPHRSAGRARRRRAGDGKGHRRQMRRWSLACSRIWRWRRCRAGQSGACIARKLRSIARCRARTRRKWPLSSRKTPGQTSAGAKSRSDHQRLDDAGQARRCSVTEKLNRSTGCRLKATSTSSPVVKR